MMTMTMLLNQVLVTGVLIVGGPWDPDQPVDASIQLVRAGHLDSTQGNLEEAIALYRQIVADDTVPAELAARARFELANCLVRLGEAAAKPAPAPPAPLPIAVPEPPVVPALQLLPEPEIPRDPEAPAEVVEPRAIPAPAAPADAPVVEVREETDWEGMLGEIQEKSLLELDQETLEEAMLDGVAEILGKHAQYFSPKELSSFRVNMSLNLVGIGAMLEIADEGEALLIHSALPESPAEKAKLQSGDKIVTIDGKELSEVGTEMSDYVHAIRGKVGSKILLGIVSEDGKRSDISITREKIALSETTMIAPVYETDPDLPKWMVNEKAGIGALRLRSFPVGLADGLKNRLNEMKDLGLRGLVIDLRGNGGGSLSESLGAAGLFVGDALIVTTKSRDGTAQEHRGKGGAILDDDLPVLLLVDRQTASAAEIFAAALQDHGRAVVLGERTFGKGTVETLIELDNGGAMKFPISEFVRPSGTAMKKPENKKKAEKDPNWGVRPDEGWQIPPAELPRDLDDRGRFKQDPVWNAAMRYLGMKLSFQESADE